MWPSSVGTHETSCHTWPPIRNVLFSNGLCFSNIPGGKDTASLVLISEYPATASFSVATGICQISLKYQIYWNTGITETQNSKGRGIVLGYVKALVLWSGRTVKETITGPSKEHGYREYQNIGKKRICFYKVFEGAGSYNTKRFSILVNLLLKMWHINLPITLFLGPSLLMLLSDDSWGWRALSWGSRLWVQKIIQLSFYCSPCDEKEKRKWLQLVR